MAFIYLFIYFNSDIFVDFLSRAFSYNLCFIPVEYFLESFLKYISQLN